MPDNRPPAARYETIIGAGPEAPWLALVHGVSQDRRLFGRQVEAFKDDFRLVLIDLPGHGLSAEIPGPYGVEEFAASIAGALGEAGVEACHFWGTHLGAAAGLLQACRRPEAFRSLVLEGPVFPGRPLPAVAATLAGIAETATTDGIAAAREKWWREGEWFAVMRERPKACRAAAHRAMIDDFAGKPWLDAGLVSRPIPPLDGHLRELALPVLIMNGEHDLSDFLEAARALEDLLPNGRSVRVEEGGGFPLWEFPNRVNREVRGFLEAI